MISDVLAGRKNYAYVNARVRARRANMVSDQEYRKLVKMDMPEIAEFLGQRGYGREMEELGADYEGEELIEKAVRQNLARTYRELMRMSPGPVQELLSIYFRKFDIDNVKTIIRAKKRGEDVSDLLVPTDELGQGELERLMEMDTAEEVLDAFDLPGFSGDVDVADGELAAVEDALDVYYYTNLVEKGADIGGKSELFRTFIELEAVLKNVSLVLRMKRRGYGYAEIEDRLIPVPGRRRIDPVELAGMGGTEEIVQALRESPAGEFIAGDTPAEIQRGLERYKLAQGVNLMHQDQLGMNPVLGFMVCKEVEARNLQMLARAKEEGLGEDFIERNLVEGVAR